MIFPMTSNAENLEAIANLIRLMTAYTANPKARNSINGKAF